MWSSGALLIVGKAYNSRKAWHAEGLSWLGVILLSSVLACGMLGYEVRKVLHVNGFSYLEPILSFNMWELYFGQWRDAMRNTVSHRHGWFGAEVSSWLSSALLLGESTWGPRLGWGSTLLWLEVKSCSECLFRTGIPWFSRLAYGIWSWPILSDGDI